jgi:hypothetical protein
MPHAAPVPRWLERPTRWSRLDAGQARIVLALLAALLLACFTALNHPASAASPGGEADIALYAGIVEAMRHGAGYYTAAASALRDGGYPLHPFLTFRLPGLAIAESVLPPLLVAILLLAVVVGAASAWCLRMRKVVRSGFAFAAALVLVVLALLMFAQPQLTAFHEIWVGPLIALSLALRRPGRWQEAVLVALIAMLIRETALLFALVMGALALIEGARREALGWAAAIALFAVVLACHAVAATAAADPLDPASPGWSGLLGFGFAVRAIVLTTPFTVLPVALAAPLVGLALFGWASWADPTGLRGTATLVVYIALLGIAAHADTFYWAALIGPIVPLGLVFVPDALRTLAARALDRRRITVTRVER